MAGPGRRSWLPTVTTFFMMLWFIYGWILSAAVVLCLLFTKYYWITVLLFTWSYLDNAHNRGGRRFRLLRYLPIFQWWRDYFPVKLVKTTELSANQNYIFGYHPHGYSGIGTLCSFMTEALNVSASFPGLRVQHLTTRYCYFWPIHREWFLSLGASNASAENMKYITSKGHGNAMIVVVGGVAEMLEARPGESRLVIRSRKGFVKMALITGSHLVPVYAYGENDVYIPSRPNPPGSRVRKFQEWTRKTFRGLPVGAFFYGPSKIFTWLPLPHAITVVVGEPILVTQNANPTPAEIDLLHEKYLQSLSNLYEKHKDRYGCGTVTLEFV